MNNLTDQRKVNGISEISLFAEIKTLKTIFRLNVRQQVFSNTVNGTINQKPFREQFSDRN